MKYTFEDYMDLPGGSLELIDGDLYLGGEPVRLIIFERDVEQLSELGKSHLESLEQFIAHTRERMVK